MFCANCHHWRTQAVTDYEDGTRIINFKTEDGKGQCEVLDDRETDHDFGCIKFVEGHEHIEIMGRKSGSPWQHSEWGQCPDCSGVGWGCRRCAATGRVLYYDDGYVGEEQTRRHPKEITGGQVRPTPSCINCKRDLDPNWAHCPYCGVASNKPAAPVRVSELDTGWIGYPGVESTP